jgi:hypothetical protein
MSTGSITVNITAGNGNYNYKAIGAVTTQFTSSNIITGLQPGTYQLVVKDINGNCADTVNNIIITGSYADPRFQLNKTDVSCARNDGTIDVFNVQYGRSPFDYTIIAPSPSNVGTTNSTGHFTGLTPGEYAIQLKDSCGGIQVRHVTIEDYSWWFDNVLVTKISCDSADATINLKDNKGNLNSSSSSFNGFGYGIVNSPGDTIWKTDPSFRFYLATKRTVVFVAKDLCGNVTPYTWNVPSGSKPAVSSSINITNTNCTTFTASVTGQQNLTSPTYCLYEDNNPTPISCSSSPTFSNIPYGSYCIKTTDNCYDTTITVCFTQLKPAPSVNANITSDTYTCTSFRARVTDQTNLINPVYYLFNNINDSLGFNSTGIFINLPYGTYAIHIKDDCNDTTIIRTFTVVKPPPVITSVSRGSISCSDFTATVNGNNFINPEFCLYDDEGNIISCGNTTGVFTNLPHGSYCIRAISCGDTTASFCFNSDPPTASVNASVQISNKACTDFTARITGQNNLSNSDYCLYDNNDVQISCNQTGEFINLPYGSYCIKITNACLDTIITRCFSATRPVPSISGTIQKLNITCSTFTAKVTGSNLTDPTYRLYDALNTLLATNSDGVFDDLSYGSYCAEIEDDCTDTIMRVCQTFSLSQSINVSTSKTCSFDYTRLQIDFSGAVAPYIINVYHPNGNVVHTSTTNNTSTTIDTLPALDNSLEYKIVGIDNCGFKDSVSIIPDAAHITKSVSVASKCPSSQWQNGAGTINASASSNLYAVYPSIIKKDGNVVSINYSSNTGNNFSFSDLEPATYIVQYSMQNCSGKLYDTVIIEPYHFPNENRSAIYQCDNNSFSLGAVVSGGVGPYEYEIFGSIPSSPSVITGRQPNPVFTINNGTMYSLIRLRTIDACGNAALNDVSVLPLQNIQVETNNNCLYNTTVLTVDTIPNATYQWYYKRNATDSTFLSNSMAYNLSMLEQEETGQYVCKVSVNSGCLTRVSYITLTGDCGYVLLNGPVELKGKRINNSNQLSWSAKNTNYKAFVLERSNTSSNQFITIATIEKQASGEYLFTDKEAPDGTNIYRLRMLETNGHRYSNMVHLKWASTGITVFPNPVKDQMNILFEGSSINNYQIQLINVSGQVLLQNQLKGFTNRNYQLHRTNAMNPGIYFLKIINNTNNSSTIHKLLFD